MKTFGLYLVQVCLGLHYAFVTLESYIHEYIYESSVVSCYGSCALHVREMRSCKPKTGTTAPSVAVCNWSLTCTQFSFLGVHHGNSVHSLNWKDVATRKDDNVFDDFAGAQVLPLNLWGIRNGLSSNSTSLCQWHNPGFTNKRLVLNVSAGLPGTCSSQLHQNNKNNNYRDSGS